MPTHRAIPLTSDRSAAILAEALRRIDRAIPDPVNLGALRRALETEMAKGPVSLVALMKVGRRRALDRICRIASKDAHRRDGAHGTPPPGGRRRPLRPETAATAIGTVVWFDATKGFGLIRPEAGGSDVSVQVGGSQRVGLDDLSGLRKASHELVADRGSGETSAGQIEVG